MVTSNSFILIYMMYTFENYFKRKRKNNLSCNTKQYKHMFIFGLNFQGNIFIEWTFISQYTVDGTNYLKRKPL